MASSAVLKTLFDGRVMAIVFVENKDPFLANIFPECAATKMIIRQNKYPKRTDTVIQIESIQMGFEHIQIVKC